tara:strand:- start:4162 stop:4629 length:468 start_codon:yes stop_codon:yes gene_type:complete
MPEAGRRNNWRLRSMSDKTTTTERAVLDTMLAWIITMIQPNIERTVQVKMEQSIKVQQAILARLDALWEKVDSMFSRLDDVEDTAVEAETTSVTHEQLSEALANINIEKEIYNSISELDEKINNTKSELADFVTQQGTHGQLLNMMKEVMNEFHL